MKAIGLDLDGVLYSWHRSIYEYFHRFKGYEGTCTDFWTTEYKKFDEEWWNSIVTIDIFYSDRQPTKDCFNFLDNIKDRFEIYYITGRPNCVKTTTEQYLRRFKFPFRDNLIFSNDKVNVARLLKLSYAVDDLPNQVESLSKVTRTIMVAQPYNKELWDTYTTVHSLTEILNYLED